MTIDPDNVLHCTVRRMPSMDRVNLYESKVVMQYKGPASLHTTHVHVQIADTQHIIEHSCIYIHTYEPYPPCSLTCDFCGKMLMATGRASPKQRVATTACTGRTNRGLDRRNLVLQVVEVGAK